MYMLVRAYRNEHMLIQALVDVDISMRPLRRCFKQNILFKKVFHKQFLKIIEKIIFKNVDL